MKKILWIDDGEILKHPIASQLYSSLKQNKFDITLATQDSVNNFKFFRTSKGDFFTTKYVARKTKRKRISSKLSTSRIAKFKYLTVSINKLISEINDLDKMITSLIGYKFERLVINLLASFKVSKIMNGYDYILLSRGYVFPFLVHSKIMNLGKFYPKIIYYPFELYGHQYGVRTLKIFRAIERYCIKNHVSVLVTQNELRANYYRDLGYRKKLLILRNYKIYYPHNNNFSQLNKHIPKLLFLGLVNGGRSIDEVLIWISQNKLSCELTIIGKIEKSWINKNRELIESLRNSKKLYMYDSMDMADLKEILFRFDAGLIIYDDACKNHLYCSPSKLTDYLHGGLPVISSNLPSMRYYADKFPFVQLYSLSNCDSFKVALQNLEKWKSNLARKSIIESSRNLSWQNEFTKLLQVLDNH